VHIAVIEIDSLTHNIEVLDDAIVDDCGRWGSVLYAIIGFSTVSMGIQGTGARRINSSGISTIVFASALISIVVYLSGPLARCANASASPTGIRNNLWTFASYVLGALLAGGLVSHYLGMLIWVPMAAVLLARGSSHFTYTPKRSAE
jgi:uncharacterized membrane protein YoaK (UPF0700 family)